MKRIAFVVAFLCPVFFSVVMAQQSSFFIGANGGVNLSKFKYTEDLSELYSSSNALFGINGGVDLGFEVNNFTITTGIQYTQKGGEYQTENFEDEQGVGFFSAEERLHFVTIPIQLGYRKYFSDQFALTIAAGPSINIGMAGNVKEEIEYFGSERVDKENYDVNFGSGLNDDYRGTQVGFQISPGMVFKVGNRSKVRFNITWDLGVGDMFNDRYKAANDFFSTYKGDQTNNTTFFTLGYEYHFNFGDKY